jgi:hypothetical protein
VYEAEEKKETRNIFPLQKNKYKPLFLWALGTIMKFKSGANYFVFSPAAAM